MQLLGQTLKHRTRPPTLPSSLWGWAAAGLGESLKTAQQGDGEKHVPRDRHLLSVRSGCSQKMPASGRLINSKSLLLTALETGSPRSRCLGGVVSAPFCALGFSLGPRMAEGLWELRGLLGGTNPNGAFVT